MSAHRISQDIANAKLIAAPIAVAIPVMLTSLASERDRESGGEQERGQASSPGELDVGLLHRRGVIRRAAHRG
jgi:hypothetical protein